MTRREEDVKTQNELKEKTRFQTVLPIDKLYPEVQESLELLPIEQLGSLNLLSRIIQDNREHELVQEMRSQA